MQILFSMFPEDESILSDDEDEISNEAIMAAINLIEVCCQQTAYMAGRGKIKDEIQLIKASKLYSYVHTLQKD